MVPQGNYELELKILHSGWGNTQEKLVLYSGALFLKSTFLIILNAG